MLAPGTLLDDRYRIGALLGQGGMAVVYRALDEALDREVAIKVLRDQYADDVGVADRFREEARSAASLLHPSIVQIFDAGDGEHPYVVMQLIAGLDLGQVLVERGRLPIGEALRIATEAAEGLQAAHDQGIVHRDIKPANILLTADGDVRVADFGVAQALAASATMSPGLALDSIPYSSPEQVLGEPVGPASDIFSLGVVLYQLVTGRRPFDGPEPASVALQRLYEDPQRPSEISPDVPDGMDELVLRALRLDPYARYPSARAMAEAMRSWWYAEGRAHEGIGSATTAPPTATSVSRRAAATAIVAGAESTDVTTQVVTSPSGAPTSKPTRQSAVLAPQSVVSVGPTWRGRRRPESRERRRAVPLLLIPLAAFLFVGTAFWVVTGGPKITNGGVLGATSQPRSSAIAALPSPSLPKETTSATISPASSPSPTPTVAVTSSPTPPPTPRPTARTTPRPTARPTPKPVVVTSGSGSPAAVVAKFYDLVETHQFETAASLWTQRMRRQYPPDGNIDGRFSRTTRIDLRRDRVTAVDLRAGTAVVAVDLIEYRSVEPSPRRFVGRWDLVLTDQGWKMDEPHF